MRGAVVDRGDRAAAGGRQQRVRLAAPDPGHVLPHPADPPPDGGDLKVAAWISSVTTGISRPTAQIAALRANGSEVARWGLIDVLPVSWQGPQLDPSGPAVATEVLEIAHHGFTDTD